MQETQNRTIQHDLLSLPTSIRVVGYTYLVDFDSTTQPRFHIVDKQAQPALRAPWRCDCPAAPAGSVDRREPGLRSRRAGVHSLTRILLRHKKKPKNAAESPPTVACFVGLLLGSRTTLAMICSSFSTTQNIVNL